MILRATTLDKKDSISGFDSRVAIRLEYSDDSVVWFNMGLHNYYEHEWLLLLSILILGTRRSNVQFEHKDLTR